MKNSRKKDVQDVCVFKYTGKINGEKKRLATPAFDKKNLQQKRHKQTKKKRSLRKEGCKRFNVCNREEKKRDTHTKARIWKQTKKEGKNEINLVHLFPLHMSTAALINEDGKKKMISSKEGEKTKE